MHEPFFQITICDVLLVCTLFFVFVFLLASFCRDPPNHLKAWRRFCFPDVMFNFRMVLVFVLRRRRAKCISYKRKSDQWTENGRAKWSICTRRKKKRCTEIADRRMKWGSKQSACLWFDGDIKESLMVYEANNWQFFFLRFASTLLLLLFVYWLIRALWCK